VEGSGWVKNAKWNKNVDLNEQTHPQPPPKEGISSFNFALVLTINTYLSKEDILSTNLLGIENQPLR
jgi:hypothetical protein